MMKWILQSAKQKLTRSVNPLTEMDEQDSKMFIAAFDDYMKHCESDSEEDWENERSVILICEDCVKKERNKN